MRMTEKSMLWVVYRMTIKGKPSVISAVCEQGEWDAMERERPGHHTLVLAGIANEGEAERLARSSSGYDNTSKPSALTRPDAKRATRPAAVPADLVTGDVGSVVLSSVTIPVQSPLP
jgi:hypothetical protein